MSQTGIREQRVDVSGRRSSAIKTVSAMHGRPKAASGKTAHRSVRSSGPDITLARYGYGASCNPLDPDQ